jgi:hypothetical protein
MDGVDVAIIETDGQEIVTLGRTGFFPYGEADRALLRGAIAEAASLDDRRARPGCLALADAMITSRHAEAVEAFLATDSIGRATVDLIGFHGQTVLHRPRRRLTVQIGDGAGLAARLGIRVVHDFRAADVAQGGQGAPLVPVFHRALAAAAGFAQPVAIINIGGVANLSFIAPGEEPIACDRSWHWVARRFDVEAPWRRLRPGRRDCFQRQGRWRGFKRTSRASFFPGPTAEIARPERFFGHCCREPRDRRRGGDAHRLHRGRDCGRVAAVAVAPLVGDCLRRRRAQ